MATNLKFPLSFSPPVSGTVRWEGTTLTFIPSAPLNPDTTYTVTLADGLRSQGGRPLLRPLIWQFRTGRPRILYIAPDEQNHDQLFVIDLVGGRPIQLTREPVGVWDYALSLDGMTIAYAASRPDTGNDLWIVDVDGVAPLQLLACPGADCTQPAWSPDGRRLVFTRRDLPGPPRLWWLDVASGEIVPVFQDEQMLGFGGRWSPDGQWLNYVASLAGGIRVYNLDDGQELLIPNQMGEPGVWSRQGDALLITDIQMRGERFAIQLLRLTLESGELTNLSGEEEVDDSSPAWSPDGVWIAFGRKAPQASMGRQLWLMHADGSQAHYLTDEPDVHHGPPTWSPDGNMLVFQRYSLKEPGAQPGIWLLELETGALQELITPGRQPTWLP
jgi:Tol biopolymer transport system component